MTLQLLLGFIDTSVPSLWISCDWTFLLLQVFTSYFYDVFFKTIFFCFLTSSIALWIILEVCNAILYVLTLFIDELLWFISLLFCCFLCLSVSPFISVIIVIRCHDGFVYNFEIFNEESAYCLHNLKFLCFIELYICHKEGCQLRLVSVIFDLTKLIWLLQERIAGKKSNACVYGIFVLHHLNQISFLYSVWAAA